MYASTQLRANRYDAFLAELDPDAVLVLPRNDRQLALGTAQSSWAEPPRGSLQASSSQGRLEAISGTGRRYERETQERRVRLYQERRREHPGSRLGQAGSESMSWWT